MIKFLKYRLELSPYMKYLFLGYFVVSIFNVLIFKDSFSQLMINYILYVITTIIFILLVKLNNNFENVLPISTFKLYNYHFINNNLFIILVYLLSIFNNFLVKDSLIKEIPNYFKFSNLICLFIIYLSINIFIQFFMLLMLKVKNVFKIIIFLVFISSLSFMFSSLIQASVINYLFKYNYIVILILGFLFIVLYFINYYLFKYSEPTDKEIDNRILGGN